MYKPLWVAVVSLALVNPLHAQSPVRGCLMLGCSIQGNMLFDFFVKVDDSEYDAEDGSPQILGYRPEDVHRDKDGKVELETVLASRFIRGGSVGSLPGCVCHCPNW